MEKLTAAAIAAGALLLLNLNLAPARAQDATFEVASIKPNLSGSDVMAIMPPAGGRFTATNVSLGILMAVAYDVRSFQISGLPGWAWSEKYDLIAKAEGNPNRDEFRSMMQRLLAERFQLRLHRETKAMKGYALVQNKRGAKPLKVHEGDCGPDSNKGAAVCGGFAVNVASLDGTRVDMKQLASTLAQQRDVGRPVVDKTGIPGFFDVHISWSAAGSIAPSAGLQAVATDDSVSVFTALQEQLRLRLDPDMVETEVLIVDQAEKLSEN
jgi:bla regulator protein BlaR1